MKYNEVITLDENFQPAVDLTNEQVSYWKRFIPNIKFYEVLTKTLNSLESKDPKESQSLWMEGTYGAGKSHAISVVKHLLSDPEEDFRDFIHKFEGVEGEQLRNRLLHFRESNKICPIILKGLSMVTDSETFGLAIQLAVKKTVPDIAVKDDFEAMIYQVEINPMQINWQKFIENSELWPHVRSPQELVKKLKDSDLKIFITLQKMISKTKNYFSTLNLTEWLKQSVLEIKAKKNVSSLVIFWDDFTSVLEMPNSGVLLSEIQSIAELSKNDDIYLFIIAHRSPTLLKHLEKDDVEKALGRFKVLDYSMEPITTYHIINASLKKVDEELWDKLKDEHISKVDNAIKRILVEKGGYANEEVHRKQIENLFPIHPYTANLLTFIARHIGSTERSIFDFLFDKESGFKNFINNNPDPEGEIFLTVDRLWDFFYQEFERINDEKMSSSLERYKLYREIVEKEGGKEASKKFKAILLLNILYKFTDLDETSLLAPSEDNIRSIFSGAVLNKSMDEILSFFVDKQVLDKKPNGLYFVSKGIIRSQEVEKAKEELKEGYKDITFVLTEDAKNEFVKTISNAVRRELEINFLDAKDSESILENKLAKAFSVDSTIHIALLIGRNDQEILQAKEKIGNLAGREEFKNVVFVLLQRPFDKQTFEKYVDYRARAQVAERHNYIDDIKDYEESARQVINEWTNNNRAEFIYFYLRDKHEQTPLNLLSSNINDEISTIIFSSGVENIPLCRKNINIWKRRQQSKKAVEIFLFASARSDIEEKTAGGVENYLKGLIQDNFDEYVVDANLNFKDDVNQNHPLKKMSIEINKAIENTKSKGNFNLGEELEFLKKPPFGLYQNMLSLGALAFLMRQYTDKLYEEGTGIPIGKENMREKILSIFKFWENGSGVLKLNVRFGTAEEKELIKVIKEVFEIDEPKSLNDAKWKIREKIKNTSYPLWAYYEHESLSDKVKNAIKSINEFIETVDQDTTQNKIYEYLSAIQDVTIDLKEILERDREEDLFKSWIKKNVENIPFDDESFKELMDYLKVHMQEEVALWKEDKAREKVKDWLIKKISPPSLIIYNPQNNSVIEDPKTTIRGQTEPNTEVTINDNPVDVSSNGTFSFEVPVSEPSVFTIVARNKAGKMTQRDLNVSPKKQPLPPHKKKEVIDKIKKLDGKQAKELLLKLAQDDDIARRLEKELGSQE